MQRMSGKTPGQYPGTSDFQHRPQNGRATAYAIAFGAKGLAKT
jgi:hypothetical protein